MFVVGRLFWVFVLLVFSFVGLLFICVLDWLFFYFAGLLSWCFTCGLWVWVVCVFVIWFRYLWFVLFASWVLNLNLRLAGSIYCCLIFSLAIDFSLQFKVLDCLVFYWLDFLFTAYRLEFVLFYLLYLLGFTVVLIGYFWFWRLCLLWLICVLGFVYFGCLV